MDLSGFARTTLDVDILVEDSTANLERLLTVLHDFGSGSARELSPADFTRDEGAIRANQDFPEMMRKLLEGQP